MCGCDSADAARSLGAAGGGGGACHRGAGGIAGLGWPGEARVSLVVWTVRAAGAISAAAGRLGAVHAARTRAAFAARAGWPGGGAGDDRVRSAGGGAAAHRLAGT